MVALVAGIVVVLVLGMGGLLAVRVRALVELTREARRQSEADDPQTARRRRRRVVLVLISVGVFYVIAACLFFAGRAMSGTRLGAGLVGAWVIVAVVGGFTAGLWWDARHGNL